MPAISTEYKPVWTPSPGGESIEELYARVAYVLARMICDLDADPRCPTSVLICTHAATLVAIGRVLTGHKPTSVVREDYLAFTASLSIFHRRREESVNASLAPSACGTIPDLQWSNGIGIGGGWDCIVNGNCEYLRYGQERGWYVELHCGCVRYVFIDVAIQALLRKGNFQLRHGRLRPGCRYWSRSDCRNEKVPKTEN